MATLQTERQVVRTLMHVDRRTVMVMDHRTIMNRDRHAILHVLASHDVIGRR
jgi:hypothetical protein